MTVSYSKIEDPFEGEYENFPLRTLILTSSREMENLTVPLQQWAEGRKYKFRVSSPTGRRGSILFQIWNGMVVIIGDDRMDGLGLRLDIYLNSDTADNQMLNGLAEQIHAILVPFGSVEVTSAPPGTHPRRESTNTWRRR